MQKGFAGTFIIIGVLIVGLGIAGAWYTKIIQIPNFPPPGCRYQQVQCIQAPCNPILICDDSSTNPAKVSQATPSPAPTVSPAPTGAENSPVPNGTGETANWKTYSNKNFSFRYPPNWDLNNCGAPEVIDLDNKVVNCAGGFSDISIARTFDKKYSLSFDKSISVLVEERTISLDGKDAVQADFATGNQVSGLPYTVTEVINGDAIYDVRFYSDGGQDETSNRNIYSQILSTFKFIN